MAARGAWNGVTADGMTASGGWIAAPLKVLVVLDEGEFELQKGANGRYTYRDIWVQLSTAGSTMSIAAGSPTRALHAIRLQWDYPDRPTDRILGDHWERTYGDVGFYPASFDKKLPWYFIAAAGDSAVCMGVKTGANAICYWQAGEGRIRLTLDTRSGGVGVRLGDRVLPVATVITTTSHEGERVFATGRRFCGLLSETPRLTRQRVYGINDWYYAYGNNSAALILQQTRLMADLVTDTHNRPFSLVDAGWALYSPLQPGSSCWMDDFARPNDKFKDMGKLAADIRQLGMRPALWTRPLCAAHDDPASLLLPSIPGRDDPKSPVLDPSIEENLARVRHNIQVYRQWGYEMVKHDFSTYDILGKWGFEMGQDITTPGWRFHDNTRTTAEIILSLYRAIRSSAGEDLYVIGCNTVGHLSAGLFELNRVGDDTSGKEWDRTRKMGVNTLGFRMLQHENFYAADGDCVGLTKDVPWEKNRQWMQLVAGSGTPLFISAQPDALGAAQRQAVKESFAMAARKLPPGEPLDWLTNPLPKQWRLDGEVKTFDWG